MKREKLEIVLTKSGHPAAWEKGGGATRTGWARIWAQPDGSKPRALYIRRKGHLACGEHALVPIYPGMISVYASHRRGTFRVEVARVVGIEGNEAVLEPLATYDQGEWDRPLPPEFEAAVEAARKKALVYHCRAPVYVEAPER